MNGPDFNFNGGVPYHMRLTLQQLPYDCPDPSFEFRDPSDILERVFVTPYKPAKLKNNELPVASELIPIEEPGLEDVEPSMLRHDFVIDEPAGNDQADTNPPPEGHSFLLGLHDNEPSPSYCSNLKVEVQHAVTRAWKFDPVKCSISVAREAPRQLIGAPGQAFTCKELKYVKALKVSQGKAQKKEVEADSAAVMQCLTWQTHSQDDDLPSELDEATLGFLLDDFFGAGDVATWPLESSALDQVLDDFYGPGDIATRPLESHEVDEGFYDSPYSGSSISTTWVTLPENIHVASGQASTNGGSFQDSGIYMDDAFTEASLSDSSQKTSALHTEQNPEEIVKDSASCPTFNANFAPPVRKRTTAPWLHRIGGNYEYDWKSRHEAPYDLEGFRSPEGDRDESSNGFEPMLEIDETAPPDPVMPDTRASRSPETFPLDDTPTQTIAQAQDLELSTAAADNAPQSMTAVATQLYHPQATSLLKHKCLPKDDSLNVEDDGGDGVNQDQADTRNVIDSSGSLDVDVSKSPAHESPEQLTFSQYVQEISTPPILARESTSTPSINGSPGSHPENLALTPQAEMASKTENAALRGALDAAFIAALNPHADMASDPEDSALTPEEKSPTTPLFSTLTPTEKEASFFEIAAQPSSSTDDPHILATGFTFDIPSGPPTHATNGNNGTCSEAAAPVLLTPQPQQSWDPLYQLPSLLGSEANNATPTPSHQLSQLNINATASTPTKSPPTPIENLGKFHITTQKRFMPDTTPGTPTPAPKADTGNQHRVVTSFRNVSGPAHAMKLKRGYKNVFNSPQLGGKTYSGASEIEENGENEGQEPRESLSDAVVEEDVDEAEALVLAAVKKLEEIGAQKQSARRQSTHNLTAKKSVAEVVVVPSQATQIEEQQTSVKEVAVVPSKNKKTEEKGMSKEEPAKKKPRKSGTRRSGRQSVQTDFFS
ncbi:hypothetical protein OEA41_006593 [Lepraria neglecta]|uniref:Uncharacterized protein n=1 Tax=Lepraria neglecta TaxID=209136 RepID=A0AAD9Z7Z7_9LECA|nr:hypothetical protein OEA41_006593 [Lepraria neglecta]